MVCVCTVYWFPYYPRVELKVISTFTVWWGVIPNKLNENLIFKNSKSAEIQPWLDNLSWPSNVVKTDKTRLIKFPSSFRLVWTTDSLLLLETESESPLIHILSFVETKTIYQHWLRYCISEFICLTWINRIQNLKTIRHTVS